jgi:rsbT antagonist protein RsbS
MGNFDDIPQIALQVSRGIVVASIQIELDDGILARFREDLLERIHGTGARGVILDLSALETLDSHEFATLRGILEMTGLLGAKAVLVGMQPGVVSSLIDLGADVDGVRAAINMDVAFDRLRAEIGTEDDPEGLVELDAEPDSPDVLPDEPDLPFDLESALRTDSGATEGDG